MLPSVKFGYVKVWVDVPVVVKSVELSKDETVVLYLQIASSLVVMLIVVEVVPAVKEDVFVGTRIVI